MVDECGEELTPMETGLERDASWPVMLQFFSEMELLPESVLGSLVVLEQEAQLPQRDSASATYVFLGSLTDRAFH